MKIKKSEVRRVVKEHLQMFYSDMEPFATVGRGPTLAPGIEDPNSEEIEVDKEALEAAIEETIKGLEKGASLRMRAEAMGVDNVGSQQLKKMIRKLIVEISGVDSLKPNDPHTPEDEAEKDAADDVMEATPKLKLKAKEFYTVVALRPDFKGPVKDITGNKKWKVFDQMAQLGAKEVPTFMKMVRAKYTKQTKYDPKGLKFSVENDAGKVVHSEAEGWDRPDGLHDSKAGLVREKKKDKIRRRPWVSGLDPAGGIGESHGGSHKAKEMEVKDKEGFMVDLEGKQDVGSLAQTPKGKALAKKMHDMVSKKLKLKSIEDVQPIKDGIAFIFGDPSDAKKMAAHLKKAGALGKVMKLAAGGGKRTLVSLKTQSRLV